MGKQLINTGGDGETCLHSDSLTDLARNINTFLPAIESWAGGAPALHTAGKAKFKHQDCLGGKWAGVGPENSLFCHHE